MSSANVVNVVPGWTMSSNAVADFIDYAVDRPQLIGMLEHPENGHKADEGKTKYVNPNYTVIVNEAMKTIIAIHSNFFVSQESKARRREAFALISDELRDLEMAREEPRTARPWARRPPARKVPAGPVQVRRMAPSNVVPATAPKSFNEVTVEAYSAYWRNFMKELGIVE